MTEDAVVDATDGVDAGVIDLDAENPAAVAARHAPYVFDTSHVAVGAAVIDEAFATHDVDWHYRGTALRNAAEQHELTDPLLRELVFIAEYRLRHADPGRAGCELEPQRSTDAFSYPPAIQDAAGSVVELWQALVGEVTAPLARARMADLLLTRREGNVPALAAQAVDGYLTFGTGTKALSFDVVDALIRAWTLTRRFFLAAQQTQARTAMLNAAALVVASGESPGVALPLLAALSQESAGDPAFDDVLTDLLARAMTAYSDRPNIVAELGALRRARATSDDERRQIDREEAESALARAEASSGAVRVVHLQEAIRVARRRDVPDVRARATALLQQTDPAELPLQPIVVRSSRPVDMVTPFLAPFTMSSDWRDGLDYFLSIESPMGSVDRLRKTRQDESDLFRLAKFFPPLVLRHDGLPTWEPPSEDAREAYDLARIALSHAETWGRLLADGLRLFADEYGPPEAAEITVELVARWGCDERLARVLAHGLHYFWRDDFEACVHVVIPKMETALRGLLRELDEAVYQEQVGNDPGGFPGMYVMLRAIEKLGFDPDWVYFLKTLLLEPPGRNIRNDLAHGSLPDVGPVYAALVLRAAALLIVLTPPQPGGLGDSSGNRPPLVTAEERAAARAALLARIAAPLADPVSLPAPPITVELPEWALTVARAVRQVRSWARPSRWRARP